MRRGPLPAQGRAALFAMPGNCCLARRRRSPWAGQPRRGAHPGAGTTAGFLLALAAKAAGAVLLAQA